MFWIVLVAKHSTADNKTRQSTWARIFTTFPAFPHKKDAKMSYYDNPLVEWKFLQVKRSNKKSAPKPCFLQSCTPIGAKMLIYGGCNVHGEALNQLYVYDTASFQWSEPAGDVGDIDHPGPRYGHSASVVEMHPPRVLVYGGMIESNTYEFEDDNESNGFKRRFMSKRKKGKNKALHEEPDNGVYFLELNSEQWKWTKPLINGKGPRPMARSEHSACKINTNELGIFGGWTDKPTNELWILNYVDMEWTQAATSGIQPRPRYRHTAEVVSQKMIIMGGSDNNDDVADGQRHLSMHELDLNTMEWTHPELRGGNPFPRSGHGSSVIGAHSIVIFGGKRSEEVFLNDLIIVDVETYSFTTVNVVETAVPTPIGNCSLTAVGNSCFVFGGTDAKGMCYNDIRTLDVSAYLDSRDITVSEGASSDYSFKILIIGDASVGKSAILTRFSENVFLPSYTSTIGIDFNSRMIRVGRSICKLEIWDTAGQERFSTITANYYRGAQGALLVYDISLRESFEKVRAWYTRAKQLGGEDIVPILIGNKSDLSSSREVSTSEGQALAKELGVPFMETSALSGDNVESAFVKMTARIKDSVDKRGITGVHGTNATVGGRAQLTAGDRKMTMRDKCGCN